MHVVLNEKGVGGIHLIKKDMGDKWRLPHRKGGSFWCMLVACKEETLKSRVFVSSQHKL